MDEIKSNGTSEVTETPGSETLAPCNNDDFCLVEECVDVAAAIPQMATLSDSPSENLEPSPAKSIFRDNIAAFGFSQQGSSHIAQNIPCQDHCGIRYLDSKPIVVCAIADGVGSCEMSHYGSDAAVQAALDTVVAELEPLADAPDFVFLDNQRMKNILVKAFEAAVDYVVETAQNMGSLPFSYQSTLTVAIYDGKSLYFGHAGDDGIVALCKDGTCQMVTARHKGDEANSVVPLQAQQWQFGLVDREVACFVAMTDGVLDAVVGNQLFDNRIYYPFFDLIFGSEFVDEESVEKTCRCMFDILASDDYRERVHDDLTLVAVVNSEMLASTKKPVFDRDAWDKKNEEVKQKIDSTLYTPKPAAQPAPHPSAPPSPAPPLHVASPEPSKPVSIRPNQTDYSPLTHQVPKSAPEDPERLLNRVRSSLQNSGCPDRSKPSPDLTADLNELKRLVRKSSKQLLTIAHTSALDVSNQVIQHIDKSIVEFVDNDDQPNN